LYIPFWKINHIQILFKMKLQRTQEWLWKNRYLMWFSRLPYYVNMIPVLGLQQNWNYVCYYCDMQAISTTVFFYRKMYLCVDISLKSNSMISWMCQLVPCRCQQYFYMVSWHCRTWHWAVLKACSLLHERYVTFVCRINSPLKMMFQKYTRFSASDTHNPINIQCWRNAKYRFQEALINGHFSWRSQQLMTDCCW
jgi:hypothetical protein